jgi:NAD(P)H-hydrate epimerase
MDLHLVEITDISDLPEELEQDYIVEAIFGTGFSGSPRGLAGDLIEYIAALDDKVVISVDMPSGLNADNGQHEGAVIEADYSFPLALPKYGLYVSPGRELAGEVHVVPIGVPPEVIEKADIHVDLITAEMVSDLLPERPPDGHKGTFGKLLVLAGSFGMTGAAALAGKSAYRAGCGLVKVACPRAVLPIIASLVAELTSHPLPDVAKRGALAIRGLGEIRQLLEEHDAVAIGPGIGRHRETVELIHRLVRKLDVPAVIDADGLNAFEEHSGLIGDRVDATDLVLTPHPGEFKRLTGEMPPEEIHARIETVLQWAKQFRAVLVLKGSPTVVGTPDGRAYVNPTGNNGLGCGGTGDVLTGTIGSFLAQGMSAEDAAVCAVFVHGLAGDLAADDLTQRAMISGDLVDYLPEVFAILE